LAKYESWALEYRNKFALDLRDEKQIETYEEKTQHFDAGTLTAWKHFKKLGGPASRITADDKANNRKSLNRKLDERVYLIVKKTRSEHAWQFPQGLNEKEETLRKTAEREFKEECGSTLKVYFISNAPIGFVWYTYSPEIQQKTDSCGAKVFFYGAQYLSGQVTLDNKELIDYLWVSRDELKEYFSKDYYDYISNIIVPKATYY